jgi:hypothetical protein
LSLAQWSFVAESADTKWSRATPRQFLATLAHHGTRVGAIGTLVLSVSLVMDRYVLSHRSAAGRQRLVDLAHDPRIPPVSRFVYGYRTEYTLLFLALCVAGLVSAWGLKARKEWARVAMMAILAALGVWLAVTLALEFMPLTEVDGSLRFGSDPAGFFSDPDPVARVMFIVITLLIAAFAIRCGWMVRRLSSPAVRAEFEAPAS